MFLLITAKTFAILAPFCLLLTLMRHACTHVAQPQNASLYFSLKSSKRRPLLCRCRNRGSEQFGWCCDIWRVQWLCQWQDSHHGQLWFHLWQDHGFAWNGTCLWSWSPRLEKEEQCQIWRWRAKSKLVGNTKFLKSTWVLTYIWFFAL